MGLRCCVEDPAEAELLRQLLDYAQAGDDSATQAAMALCDIACMRSVATNRMHRVMKKRKTKRTQQLGMCIAGCCLCTQF